MKTIYIIICTLLFSGIFEYIQAKNKENQKTPLEINLAEFEPGTINTLKKDKNYVYDCIKLENAVVGYKYSIDIDKKKTDIPVLSFSEFTKGGQSDTSVPDSACSELSKAIKTLDNAYSIEGRKQYFEKNKKNFDETELSKRITKTKKILDNKVCKNDSLNDLARQKIEQSNRYFYQDVSIEPGETVTITIKRDSLTWTYILKGESLGKWVTSYGFGFTSSALGGNTYYAKQIPDTSLYKILKSKNIGSLDLNYIPAVFFSFYPSQNFNKCWNHSLTAGLGFDLSAPVVFFGYNGMFWQNLGLSLGVAFQQQYRLKDKYSENDIISYLPDKEQLPLKEDLHDKVYRPNLFIAINFRFGENPFKSTDKKEK